MFSFLPRKKKLKSFRTNSSKFIVVSIWSKRNSKTDYTSLLTRMHKKDFRVRNYRVMVDELIFECIEILCSSKKKSNTPY